MLRRQFLFQSLALNALLGSANCLAQTKTAIPLYFFERKDTEGKLIGFYPDEMEFVDFIERETGLLFERYALPWARAQELARQGKGMLFGFTKTRQRTELFDFSAAMAEIKVWGITLAERKIKLRSAADLKGLTVSIVTGSSLGIEFEAAVDALGLKVEKDIPAMSVRMLKLINHRCDVLLASTNRIQNKHDFSESFWRDHKLDKVSQLNSRRFSLSEQVLFAETIHFAAAKGRYPDALKRISEVLVNQRNSPAVKKFIAGY